ncbi:queuosine precursor transporter [Glutamicibacter sp. MNS18]|uniref:queuosine precursor transporter n=1 Tax=Glutamicibacter sp. MNS18 TaxID=2989817 RepID=UPI0022367176|nr:queuosine precursor transporter [Glutamicibacter sp. MNS18]MCW4465834.1 queuosine precursor transporter [Glutamicibacter sp. MNS18]
MGALNATPKPARTSKAVFAAAGSPYFSTVLALMGAVVILSNIGASKGVAFGPLITDGGFFLFPLAYILGDVISEVYGFKAARRSILVTFGLAIFSVLAFWVMIALPSADFYDGQDALERTLGPIWRIVFASILGFLVGQMANAWVLVKLKERFGERGLIGRLIGSSGVGEFLDTLIFCSIAASVIGISTAGEFMNYVVVGFVYKTGVEIIFVPLTSLVIRWFKRREPGYAQQPTQDGGNRT